LGLPVGHGSRNLTLPLGLAATLDAEAGLLTYHEAATAP
jgi:muramoyltetrapeptide carboxypeptidase LdcA involved in peptidoglycan recycling